MILARAKLCFVDSRNGKSCSKNTSDGVLLCLDAISGLKSGRAADSKTLVVCASTASRNVIVESSANPDFVISTKCVDYARGHERRVF